MELKNLRLAHSQVRLRLPIGDHISENHGSISYLKPNGSTRGVRNHRLERNTCLLIRSSEDVSALLRKIPLLPLTYSKSGNSASLLFNA